MTDSHVLLDTNVASYLFKYSPESERYRRHIQKRELALALISVAELRYGARRANWGSERCVQLERYIGSCTLIPGSGEIARVAAKVMDQRKRVGRRMEWPDAWVAATALVHRLPLISHDADFFGVEGLRLITELTQVKEPRPTRGEKVWSQTSATAWLVSYLRELQLARTTA